MGKKRKVSRRSEPSGPRDVDLADARLGPITSYKDVADSEDEYFLSKDSIDLEDQPHSKRMKRRAMEEGFLELSDEEVLAGGDDSDDSSDASDDDSDDDSDAPARIKSAPNRGLSPDVDDNEAGESDEEEGQGWWGVSKKEYYNADQIQTEQEALDEEKEARRLQRQKLAQMADADYGFNEVEFLARPTQSGETNEVVTEVLKDVEIPSDMEPDEKYKILQARYPEFDHLVDEFQELQPLLPILQKEAEGKPSRSVEVVKYWVLGSYIAALATYFAILTSPSRDGSATQRTLDPAELRDHDVMATLVECRQTWVKVKNLKSKAPSPTDKSSSDVGLAHLDVPAQWLGEYDDQVSGSAKVKKASKKPSKEERLALKQAQVAKKAAAVKAKHAQAIEASLADLSGLVECSTKASATALSKSAATSKAMAHPGDYNVGNGSEFGDEDALDAHTAAEKAARKKSLSFYTSHIVQKSNKRANHSRDAGGDADIPYRERFRDRQARLNAEAERRGRKDSKHGATLGEDDDETDGDEAEEHEAQVAQDVREQAGEYYDQVAQTTAQKKADKAARRAALAATKQGERVVEQEIVGEDGKRKINYAIEKNKGLAPRRKKEVRNPRVKKKKKYEEKMKKLRSMRPIYKGGEGPGGYKGELSGIKAGLIKSVKL